jgi:hypothetical protein
MKYIVKNIVCFMHFGVQGKTGYTGCKMLAFDAITPVYRLCTYFFHLASDCHLYVHFYIISFGELEERKREAE